MTKLKTFFEDITELDPALFTEAEKILIEGFVLMKLWEQNWRRCLVVCGRYGLFDGKPKSNKEIGLTLPRASHDKRNGPIGTSRIAQLFEYGMRSAQFYLREMQFPKIKQIRAEREEAARIEYERERGIKRKIERQKFIKKYGERGLADVAKARLLALNFERTYIQIGSLAPDIKSFENEIVEAKRRIAKCEAEIRKSMESIRLCEETIAKKISLQGELGAQYKLFINEMKKLRAKTKVPSVRSKLEEYIKNH